MVKEPSLSVGGLRFKSCRGGPGPREADSLPSLGSLGAEFFPDDVGSAELPSMYQVLWSATACLLPSV